MSEVPLQRLCGVRGGGTGDTTSTASLHARRMLRTRATIFNIPRAGTVPSPAHKTRVRK